MQIQNDLHLHIRIPLLTVNKMDTQRQNCFIMQGLCNFPRIYQQRNIPIPFQNVLEPQIFMFPQLQEQ